MRARVFIDFWNFQLAWNARTGGALCDWPRLPGRLVTETGQILRRVGIEDSVVLEETLVYASVKASPSEAKLKTWLTGFLDAQPSFRVKVRERRPRAGGIWCNECQTETTACPSCGAPLGRAPEKGVDAAIVTDLLSLAWQGAYDLAILVSGDADFIPAVERVQEKGLKVVNATWSGHGFDLAHACWASFQLDAIVNDLVRTP